MDFAAALLDKRITIDATPALAQAFPTWYSLAAPAVRAVMAQRLVAA